MFKKLLRLKAFPAILILAMMFILCITAYGTDTDGAVSLAENAVKIVTQPQNVTVDYGSTAEVSVDVSGDGLSYKWYLKDRGATKFTKSSVSTDTYSIVLESSKDGRQVYCVVTDKYGNSVTTDTVTLKTKAVIVTQPRSVTVEEGEMARVSVSVKGRGLSYEWYYKNKGDSSFSKTSSFTGSYYSAKMDSARDGRQLYCVITDANGNKVKTNTVSINMGKFAKIVTQPKSVTVSNGGKVNVTFKAAGDGLTYTWYYKDGASLKFAKTNTFKSNSYTTVMTPARAGRQIYCVVTDKYGNSVSTDVVTLNMVGAVKITKQPVNAVAPGGTAFAINVKAEGDGLTYTWYYKEKNSTVFRKTTTFTGPTYNTIMTDARNGRQVYCVITDKYGCSVVTDTVTVIMGNPTTIVKQPENVVVPGGSDFRITVKATGDGLTYTWYYKNKGESSFTKTTSYKGAEYFATMSSARNGRQVYCVITDKYGTSVKTDTVTLIMGNPATIVKQPESVTVPLRRLR